MMDTFQILILDNDSKNLKVLDEHFQNAGFSVTTAATTEVALDILQHQIVDVVLTEVNAPGIDGFHLLKELQRNTKFEKTQVVFLSIKSDVWNRVKSLKLGAKDYIIKPVHVDEIVARINMLLKRLHKIRHEHKSIENRLTGRLEDLSVIDLIELFGTDKKTGILSVYNENGHNGQIIFQKGHVISTQTDSLHSEEAVYKMMYWNKGRFSMLFGEVSVADEMTLSNMALLLQGAKRMDLRNELLKQLPSLNAIVITTSNFKKIIQQKDMNHELKEFLTLFDGERSLGRIIDDSHENEIVTLKRIVKLYKLGFLHVLRDFSQDHPLQFKSNQDHKFQKYIALEKSGSVTKEQPVEIPADDESDKIYDDQLTDDIEIDAMASFPKTEQTVPENGKQKKYNLLVFCTNQMLLDHFIHHLPSFRTERESLDSDHAFLSGKMTPSQQEEIKVFGLYPMEQNSKTISSLQKHSKTLFLIDGENPNWKYHKYLIHRVQRELQGKVHILMINDNSTELSESEHIQEQLGIGETVAISTLKNINDDGIRTVLSHLFETFKESMPNHITEPLSK